MPGPGGSQVYVPGPKISGTTVTADASLAVSENAVPVSGSRVRDMIMTLAGDATAILTNVTRVTFRAGQVPFVDATPAQIRAMLGWYGKKAEWATGGALFTYPFHGFRGWSAPPNQGLRVEVTKNVTMKTPTLTIHEGLNDTEDSTGFAYFLSTSFNVPASSARYTIPITQPGVLVGIVVPNVADLTLLRLYDSSGLVADFADYLALQDSQTLYMGTTVVSPLYWKIPLERLVVSGVTRLEVGTGGGWVDAEFTFHTYIPAAPKQ